MSLLLEVKEPKCFKAELKSDFKDLVLKDPQVAANGLAKKIEKAKFLAVLTIDNSLAGVAALKQNKDYWTSIKDNSGIDITGSEYVGEIGYMHVASEYRGRVLGDLLLLACLSECGASKTFATIQSLNIASRRLFERHGFSRVGQSWLSKKNDDRVELYIHKPSNRPVSQPAKN